MAPGIKKALIPACNDCVNRGLKSSNTQVQKLSQTVFNSDEIRHTGGQSDKAEISKSQRQKAESITINWSYTLESNPMRNHQDDYR